MKSLQEFTSWFQASRAITRDNDETQTKDCLEIFIFRVRPVAREKSRSTSRHPATHLRDNQGTSAGALAPKCNELSRGSVISCIPYVHIITGFRNRAFYNKRKSARESNRIRANLDDRYSSFASWPLATAYRLRHNAITRFFLVN